MTIIEDRSYSWVQPNVMGDTEYHHMPDRSNTRPNLNGLTLRQALKQLRKVDFGSMGGTHIIDLSDGTCMNVVLHDCGDGTRLMSSQYVHRWEEDNGRQVTIRKYKL